MALEYLAKGNAIQLSINTLSPGCSIKWHLDLETPRHHFNKAHLSWIAVSAPFSQPGTHLRVTKSSQENTRIQRYHVNVMPLPWPLATLQPHSQPQAFLEPTCTGWVDFVNDNDHSNDSWQHLSAVARVRGPLVSHNTTTCGPVWASFPTCGVGFLGFMALWLQPCFTPNLQRRHMLCFLQKIHLGATLEAAAVTFTNACLQHVSLQMIPKAFTNS